MEFNTIKTVIAIYPGRFQPFGKHHAEAFKWLQSKFGVKDTYIATSNKVDLPKSPLTFEEKKQIISKYGLAKNLVMVKNPYQAEEITSKYDPKTTAVVFMVGEKDMKEDPRFAMKKKKDGSESYFKPYKGNEESLKSYVDHGYLVVAPNVSLDVPGFGEMSGTLIRKALSSNLSSQKYEQLFKGIFGWYDPKIAQMLKSKFTQGGVNEYTIFEHIIKKLIIEGGAAGHMAHPFDIPSVKTGKDLLQVFEKTANYLQKNQVPVKIDGINASIRLVKLDGKTQFVMDRGSNKPLDVKGITKGDLESRFGEGHGMIKVGGKVLDIFNEAFPSIKQELTQLGVLKNPNLMFNIEYVEGKSNVQEYESNFLAIHNLLGLERVSPTKRVTKEVTYDKAAMQSLIKKVDKVAKKYEFEVVGEIPAKLESKPNYSSVLSKSYTVNYSPDKKETKSLKAWLDGAKNTKGQIIKLKGGKKVDALSKQVFTWILNGKPVNDLIEDEKDTKLAVDSFVIYNATMVLGDAILSAMQSPLGSVKDQEGIVVRDKQVYDKPYKITGSFIIKGLETSFGK